MQEAKTPKDKTHCPMAAPGFPVVLLAAPGSFWLRLTPAPTASLNELNDTAWQMNLRIPSPFDDCHIIKVVDTTFVQFLEQRSAQIPSLGGQQCLEPYQSVKQPENTTWTLPPSSYPPLVPLVHVHCVLGVANQSFYQIAAEIQLNSENGV